MADAATVSVLIQAKDQASQALGNVKKNVGGLGEAFEKHRMKIGLAATAIGGAIAGIALTSVKSAVEQRKTIDMLDNALQTVGQSYEQNKKQIEDLAAAQQAKTNFGDEESRQSLATLIRVSGDYDTSLKAMVVAQDIAAGSGKALEAVTEAMARGIAGEEAALKAFIPEAVNGMGVTELLAAATAKYAGAAEAAFDPSTQLAQTVSDLQDAIGTSLLGDMDTFLGLADKVVRKIVNWIDENPKLANAIIAVTTVLGGFLLVGGPLLIMLPMLAAGWGMLSLSMLPVTATIVGITAAVYAGMLIWQNWDKVLGFVTNILTKFKIKIMEASLWHEKMRLAIGKFIGMSEDEQRAIQFSINKLESKIAASEGAVQAYEQAAERTKDAVESEGRTIERVTGETNSIREGAAEIATETSNKIVTAEEANAEAAQRSSGLIIGAYAESIQSSNEKSLAFIKNSKAESDAADAAQEAIRKAIFDIIEANDENSTKWAETGAKNIDVMRAWQKLTGETLDQIGFHWAEAGIDVNNHESVLQGFIDRFGINYFDLRKGIERDTKAIGDALTTSQQRINERMEENQSIMEAQKAAAAQAAAPVTGSLLNKTNREITNLATAGHITHQQARDILDARMAKNAPDLQNVTEKQLDFYVAHGQISAKQKADEIQRRAALNTRTGDLAGLEGASMQAKLGQFADQTERTIRSAGVRANPVMNKAQLERLTKQQIDKGWSVEKAASYSEHLKAIGYAERASGGFAGGLTLVGERGPELVSLPNGSFVHPNGTGPSGGSNNFIFNGDVYGVEDLRRVVVEAVRDHAISGGFSGVFAEA